MDEQQSGLGTAIRQRRKELSLTQAELAALAGCSERLVRALEQGKASVQLDKVTAVAEALGLQIHLDLRTEDV